MESESPAQKRQRIESFQVPAKEVIRFLFVNKHDLSAETLTSVTESGQRYEVEHTYQQFGNEMIYGYSDLSIVVVFCLDSFHVFIDVTFSQKMEQPTTTDLHHAFAEAFPLGYFTDWPDFVAKCQSEADINFEKIHFKGYFDSKLGQIRIYQYNRIQAPKDVQSFHERMESLSLFYIEGANFIDSDDDCWEVFVATRTLQDGRIQPIGYMAVFKYFVAPNSCRLEVGHVMVPPLFQNMGIGTAFVTRVNSWAKEVQAVDVTYETPTPKMQIMREKIDVQCCWSLEWIQEAVKKACEDVCGKDQNQNGVAENGICSFKLPKQIQLQMQKELKISKQQGLKVWEVLLWKYLYGRNYQNCESLLRNIVRQRITGLDKIGQINTQKCFLDRSTVRIHGMKLRTFVMMRCDKVLPSGAQIVKAKQEEQFAKQVESQVQNEIDIRMNEIQYIAGQKNLN